MGLDLLFLFHHAKSRNETEIPIYRRKRKNVLKHTFYYLIK